MKLLKVELTSEDDNGSITVMTLEGNEAEKWSEFCKSVGMCAYIHDMNPDWSSLHWKERAISESS